MNNIEQWRKVSKPIHLGSHFGIRRLGQISFTYGTLSMPSTSIGSKSCGAGPTRNHSAAVPRLRGKNIDWYLTCYGCHVLIWESLPYFEHALWALKLPSVAGWFDLPSAPKRCEGLAFNWTGTAKCRTGYVQSYLLSCLINVKFGLEHPLSSPKHVWISTSMILTGQENQQILDPPRYQLTSC